MTMRLVAVMILALAGATPASAVEVLTGTLKSVAERGEIVLGYRESSVPFSFVEGKHPDGSPRAIGYAIANAARPRPMPSAADRSPSRRWTTSARPSSW
jgi:ABC-type amino acid transport substrate-binding protein